MLIVWRNTMPRLRHFTWLHLDELHGEGGLAHAAAAEHHDLILTHGDRCRPDPLSSYSHWLGEANPAPVSACLPGVYCSTAVVWCISEIFTFEQIWVTTDYHVTASCFCVNWVEQWTFGRPNFPEPEQEEHDDSFVKHDDTIDTKYII